MPKCSRGTTCQKAVEGSSGPSARIRQKRRMILRQCNPNFFGAELEPGYDLYASFTKNRHVTFRKLLPDSQLKVFRCEIKSFPSRRVICGTGDVSWKEQAVLPTSFLYRLFCSESIFEILSSCLAMRLNIEHVTCWISVYKAGEYINRHRDRAGDIQLILSLKAATTVNGGWLNLDWRGQKHRIFF
jgi:hypothetical protein